MNQPKIYKNRTRNGNSHFPSAYGQTHKSFKNG